MKTETEDWIPLTKQLPDQFPCLVWHPGEKKVFIAVRGHSPYLAIPEGWPDVPVISSTEDLRLTHWKPLPDPPEPEVSAELLAFLQFHEPYIGYNSEAVARAAWLARGAWERQQKTK